MGTGTVHQKDSLKRSNSSLKSSGGKASQEVMNSKKMQDDADNQTKLFGNSIYVKTKKSKATIRVGDQEESSKIDTSDLDKKSIFFVDKEKSSFDTSTLFRTKSKDYYRIKSPIRYKNLWLKESHTEKTSVPKNNDLEDTTSIIETKIYDGEITTREELFKYLQDNKLPLKKEMLVMQTYELHRKKVTGHIDKIVNNIEKYNTIEEAIEELSKVEHSEYDKEKVKFEFIKSKKSKNEEVGLLGGIINVGTSGATAYGLYPSISGGIKGNKDIYKDISKLASAKEDTATVFSEIGSSVKGIYKDLTSDFSFAKLKKIINKIKDFTSGFAFKMVSTVLGGVISLVLSVKSVWNSHKLLKSFKNAKSIEVIRDTIDYGFKKIRRAFWTKVMNLFFSIIKFVSKLITILSGGLLTALTVAIQSFTSIAGALHTLYRKSKGFYKFMKGSRGKNRIKNAEEIVRLALDKGDTEVQKFMIEIMPKVDVSKWWKIRGSESTKIVIAKYKDLDNKEQDIYKKALVKNIAISLKSQ